MDPRWLPWCWAAGAAGCAVVFFAVQPWRAEWAAGFRLVRKYPASWALPTTLLGLDALRDWWLGRRAASGEAMPALARVAQGVGESLQGLHFGSGAALLGALLLAVDAWGMRRGFLKGASSVTGKPGYPLLALMFIGAVALAADPGLAGRGVPGVWHAVVTALAIPLVGWVAAALLAGLLLLAETEARAPEKVAEVRWLESAAAHSMRLWPWTIGHGILWWLGWILPKWMSAYAWEMLGPLALWLAFSPFVFLHVKQFADARQGGWQAMGFWRTQGWQLPAWLAGAGLVFYSWHLLGQGMDRAMAAKPEALRIGLATLHAIGHIGWTVMSLGAWVGFRLVETPSPQRPRRPRG